MTHTLRGIALPATAALLLAAAAGCKDFLSGGDLSNDPNRPLTATPSQLFVGVQTATFAVLQSDPARYAGLWTQQFLGGGIQYTPYYRYEVDEGTTNGFEQAIYISGGLPDIRTLESMTRASGDSLFLGISLVQEALLMGTAADLFGDIVYTHALKGEHNPALTPQLEVYDSMQVVLSDAIRALASTTARNAGPGGADVSLGGDPEKWTRVAHTLKARYYLHTAEVRGASVYQRARDEAALGILEPADDYVAFYSGLPQQQNFYYQFDVVQRPGYINPDPQFVSLLVRRADPRLTRYFQGVEVTATDTTATDLAPALIQPNSPQPVVTSAENLLILAESEARLGHESAALAALDAERANQGLGALSGVSGPGLLREILTEKYIAMFQTIEVWNDYKRTCFPNLAPVVEGQKITARLFYDTAERQTNTSIPDPETQRFRNPNDPANATDPFGGACQGQ